MQARTPRWRLEALGRIAFAREAAEFDGLDLFVTCCCTRAECLDPRHVTLLRAVGMLREGHRLHGADGLRRSPRNASLDIARRVLLGDRCLGRAFVALVDVGSAAVLREFADTAVGIVEQDIVELGRSPGTAAPARVSLRCALAAGVTMLEGGAPASIAAARRRALALEALCRDGEPLDHEAEAALRALERPVRRPRRPAGGPGPDRLRALWALLDGPT